MSGGADPSIRVWDLDSRGSELEHLYKPIASVDKYYIFLDWYFYKTISDICEGRDMNLLTPIR